MTLTELYKEKGYTRAKLSRKLGCSPQSISSWEYSGTWPSEHFMAKLVELLGPEAGDAVRQSKEAE